MALNTRKGSAPIWILAILVSIGIAFAGYFVIQADKNNLKNNQQTIKEQSSEKSKEIKSDVEQADKKTGIKITTGDSQFGSMLFDSKGQAIYIWELEDTKKAECYGDCATAWPPVLTDGMPVAAGDVNNGLLGTIQRTDGTTQVTYNDHPLYYYAHESPGEVKCHNVSTHGGLWWVVPPNGNRVK